MTRDPWYKVVTFRAEVWEGRSFSPDEFAIALEQVVAKTAPPDYRDPVQFFSRTCFTRVLKNHAGMVLRRLAGGTQNMSPAITLVTQFGGGKTHTLTALYHLAKAGVQAKNLPRAASLFPSMPHYHPAEAAAKPTRPARQQDPTMGKGNDP